MRVLLVSLGLISMLVACDQPTVEPELTVAADGIQDVAPQQIQLAQKQLHSDNPTEQLGGLKFVERFPSLLQSQRDRVVSLASSGKSSAVKQLAQKILSSASTSPAP